MIEAIFTALLFVFVVVNMFVIVGLALDIAATNSRIRIWKGASTRLEKIKQLHDQKKITDQQGSDLILRLDRLCKSAEDRNRQFIAPKPEDLFQTFDTLLKVHERTNNKGENE